MLYQASSRGVSSNIKHLPHLDDFITSAEELAIVPNTHVAYAIIVQTN